MVGVRSDKAATFGLTVDIAVALPFGMLKGVARVASVSGGTLKLSAHEAKAGSRMGGHAIERISFLNKITITLKSDSENIFPIRSIRHCMV